MTYPIWEFIINLAEASLFWLLLNRKLTLIRARHIYVKQALVITALSIILFACNFYNVSTLITVCTFVVLHYLFAILFYKDSGIVKLFWVIVYTIASITADSLTIIIPTAFLQIELNSILATGTLRIPFTLIYISLLGLFTIVMLCLTTTTFYLKANEKLIFILLSVLTIGIEQALLIEQLYQKVHHQSYHENFLSIIFFLCLFLFVTLIIYAYNLGITRKNNIKLIEEKAVAIMEQNQYEQILNSVSELRCLKHDMHNHLEVLSGLIRNQNYEELDSYIQEMNQTLEQSHYALSTGNTAVDCIITSKLNESKLSHITVEYTLHLPAKLPISDVEICSILGNLFDNAIESCNNKKENSDRWIHIAIKPFNNMLLITMKNSSDGVYRTNKHGQLLTRKQIDISAFEHGIGLNRVQELAERHNGFMNIQPEQEQFTVFIMIPLTD